MAWMYHPQWRPNAQIDFPERGVAAHYIYHPIYANCDCIAELTMTANDAVRVWHNQKLVFSLIEAMANKKTKVTLSKGWNHLLYKVVNRGGKYHFAVRASYEKSDDKDDPKVVNLPSYAAAILFTPAPSRTRDEQELLDEYYLTRDGRIPDLRKRIDLNEGRFDYATQRPFPERTTFLKAFGQPDRVTPCACERSSEPTLDQALQLLNGQQVYDCIQESVKHYADLNDRGLVEELYLAAVARFPRDKERELAEAHVAKAATRDEGIRDLVWAVLNTQEFMFQH